MKRCHYIGIALVLFVMACGGEVSAPEPPSAPDTSQYVCRFSPDPATWVPCKRGTEFWVRADPASLVYCGEKPCGPGDSCAGFDALGHETAGVCGLSN